MKKREYNRQLLEVFNAFKEKPKTMLQVSIETGILRGNICRYIRTFRERNQVFLIKTDSCPISKHPAGFYTTNPELKKA